VNSAQVKTALAALALAGTPDHLRASHGITMGAGTAPTPAAGSAPQGGAGAIQEPTPAQANADMWAEVVAEHNARLGLGQRPATGLAADDASQEPTPAATDAAADFWGEIVAAENARNDFNQGRAR